MHAVARSKGANAFIWKRCSGGKGQYKCWQRMRWNLVRARKNRENELNQEGSALRWEVREFPRFVFHTTCFMYVLVQPEIVGWEIHSNRQEY